MDARKEVVPGGRVLMLVNPSGNRLRAVVIVALFIIAPLAALSTSGADGEQPSLGWRVTYGPGDESNVTLFIGSDNVPLATWEDENGKLHLSRLNLTADTKIGVELSNLPRVAPEPIDGLVDVVAMDANGLLHVVWEDGNGGVWHKTYDDFGNVLSSNHRLSATDVTASAPAIAATVSEDGAAAWITWVEDKDRVGTHVRLVSVSGAGRILTSTLVDGILDDYTPSAVDVALDLDNEPHVTFIAEDGDYWAVPDGEDGFDIHKVHGPDEGTLPIILPVPGGVPTAVWMHSEFPTVTVWQRSLEDDGLGERSNITDDEGFGCAVESLRASDLSTIVNGGSLAIGPYYEMTYSLYANGYGELEADFPRFPHQGHPTATQSISTTTDDRGQTYKAQADYAFAEDISVRFWIIDRAPDITLRRPNSIDPLEPVLLRAGTTFETSLLVESMVGYPHNVQVSIVDGLQAPFGAEIVGDDIIEMEGGETARINIRIIASMTASAGQGTTITVTVHPEGWPDAVTSIDIPVQIPDVQPFIIRAPHEPVLALPGSSVPVTLSIESWSDDDEVVEIEIDVPRGWTAEAPARTNLPAGETVDVEIEIIAPEGIAAGTEVVLQIGGATVDGDEGAGAVLPAIVIPHTAVRMDLGTGIKVVAPDGGSNLEAMVSNTGNEPVTVHLYAQPNSEGWTAVVSPSALTLTPGSNAPVLVHISVPEGASHQTQSQVMVVVASEAGPTLDVGYFTASVGLRVTDHGLFVPKSTILMDGTTEIYLEITNGINALEEVTLEVLGLPEDWRASTGTPGPIYLSPGETRAMSVTITAPRDSDPEVVPIGIQVRGTPGPVTAWCDVHVPQVFNVDLAIEETTMTLTPPGTVVFPFEIHSVGNSPGDVRLALEGLPFGWDYTFQTPGGEPSVTFPMDVDDRQAAYLALKVPESADANAYSVELVLWSHEGGQLLRQTLYVRLRFPDLAVLDFTLLPARPEEGKPVTIRAHVLNLGMADAEDVTVVLKDGNTILDRDTLSIVPSMGELEVVLYMIPERGRRTLVLQVDPFNEIRERSEVNNMVKRHVDVAAVDEPVVPAGVVQASVAVVLTVSILALFGGTEVGRYAFLTIIFLPLYTKIKKDRVLDHYLRGKIHGYIIANPGEHYNAIKDQLEITNGALSYHLRVLERESYVRSRMDGIFKRFYPADMKLPTTQRNISSFQEVILTIVKNNQGLSQKDIAKRIGASSQVINYHIKIMEEADLIKVDRTRRKSRVYATDTPTAVPAMD